MNLEKKMFFLPNRLFVQGNEAYLSFNIAVIPADMAVVSMKLTLLVTGNPGSTLMVQQIASGWDEGLMQGGYRPPLKGVPLSVAFPPGAREIEVDITPFQQEWRFQSLENHGVKAWTGSTSAHFREQDPPYLVVTTL